MGRPVKPPFYVRALRLKHAKPGQLMSFTLLEGSIALSFLFALAELITWWGVLAVPLAVAGMVKLNDVIAGLLIPPPGLHTRDGVAKRASRRKAREDALATVDTADVGDLRPPTPATGVARRPRPGSTTASRAVGRARPGTAQATDASVGVPPVAALPGPDAPVSDGGTDPPGTAVGIAQVPLRTAEPLNLPKAPGSPRPVDRAADGVERPLGPVTVTAPPPDVIGPGNAPGVGDLAGGRNAAGGGKLAGGGNVAGPASVAGPGSGAGVASVARGVASVPVGPPVAAPPGPVAAPPGPVAAPPGPVAAPPGPVAAPPGPVAAPPGPAENSPPPPARPDQAGAASTPDPARVAVGADPYGSDPHGADRYSSAPDEPDQDGRELYGSDRYGPEASAGYDLWDVGPEPVRADPGPVTPPAYPGAGRARPVSEVEPGVPEPFPEVPPATGQVAPDQTDRDPQPGPGIPGDGVTPGAPAAGPPRAVPNGSARVVGRASVVRTHDVAPEVVPLATGGTWTESLHDDYEEPADLAERRSRANQGRFAS